MANVVIAMYRLGRYNARVHFAATVAYKSPNSPDLNPVDYSVWSILQEKVYKTRITDLDDLSNITTEPSGPSWITPSLL